MILLVPSCEKKLPGAQEIVKKAIAAHGGEANLRKAAMARVKGTSVGENMAVTWEEIDDSPGRFRKRVEGKEGNREINELFVQNGQRAWWRGPEGVVDTHPRGEAVGPFAVLFSLMGLRDGEFSLSVKKTRLRGNPALEVALTTADEQFYFSGERGLLTGVKSRKQLKDGSAVTQEVVFSDFRDVEGLHLPHKFEKFIDGFSFTTDTLVDVSFLNRVEDAWFERP